MAELEAMKAQADVEEQNKALALKSMEAWGKGDFEAYKALLAPDFSFYYPSNSPNPMSQEDVIEFAKMYRKAIADISWSMEELVGTEGKVIFRFIERGTHVGEFMGIPATGNKYETSGIGITSIENGKIVEFREEFDMLGMMMQLGMELKPKEAAVVAEENKAEIERKRQENARRADLDTG